MKNRPSIELPLNEFLRVVAVCDLKDNNVYPSDDVGQKIACELEHKTGISQKNLAGLNNLEKCQYWISAQPNDFVVQTQTKFAEICFLISNRARSFDMVFHNTKQNPNEWGDKVLLTIRYEPL